MCFDSQHYQFLTNKFFSITTESISELKTTLNRKKRKFKTDAFRILHSLHTDIRIRNLHNLHSFHMDIRIRSTLRSELAELNRGREEREAKSSFSEIVKIRFYLLLNYIKRCSE